MKAGAWLDDPLVLPHLEVFAESEDPELRRLAAVLMAELLGILVLEFALTKLVDDAELDIRLAAYEALVDLDPRPYAGFDSIPSSKWIWSTAPVL